jgi:hypothetical protein
MDEEAKQLLREIRDLMAASPARYEQALAENKRVYAEYLFKLRRDGLIACVVIGAFIALSYYW